MFKKIRLYICSLVVLSLGACGAPTPMGVEFNPVEAAKLAMEDYDEDGDGLITQKEAEKCPALSVAFQRVDADGDLSISSKEIEERIEYFIGADSTIISGEVEIKKNGKPLEGALVTFTPERFMGNLIKASNGTTDKNGLAYMSGQESAFPGIYLGFYRVTVSKKEGGTETIDAKFNTETTLGYEATDDIEEIKNVIQFSVN